VKLWIMHSVSLEDPSSYDDDFEKTSFLGAHHSLAHARKYASQIIEAETAELNEERRADGDTEQAVPTPSWTRQDQQSGPGLGRERWISDRVDVLGEYYFDIVESYLDPELS
jgi:hypothetical protein